MKHKLQILLKNPIFLILSLLALLSFIGSVILSVRMRSREIVPQSLDKPSISTDVKLRLNYTYSGELPDIAGKVAVYDIEQAAQTITEQDVARFGKEFGFLQPYKQLPGAESTAYLYNLGKEELIITTNPNKLEYGNYQESTNEKLSQDQYLEKAKQFLTSNNILPDELTLDAGYLQPMTTDPQGIAVPSQNLSTTNYVEVSFNYLLDGRPLIEKQVRDYPIKVLCNLDGTIRKATVLLLSDQLTRIGETDTTTPQQALDAINDGQGTFSQLNNPLVAYTEIRQSDMTSARFTSVELIYLYDHESGSIQPFYRFEGYGYTKNGDKIEVGVIITALPQELYKK